MSNIRPFDENEVNSALCIWEEILECRGLEEDATKVANWQMCIANIFAGIGTAAMRDMAVGLVRPLDRLWEEIDEFDGQNHMAPYDWEFVPWVISRMDWTGGHPAIPKNMLERLKNEIAVRRARTLVTR